jgi:peptidoglycan/xylan/chitin deacetylase (PgdA/CDA1 family)
MKSNIYYAELAPFRDLFRTGLPVLCYHKIGSKPAGVRLRGIYVSRPLFGRQMRGLKAAGYRSIPMDDCVGFVDKGKGVVLTFDDGSRTVLDNAMDSLSSSGFRAINYLVSDLIGDVNQWDVVKGEVPDPLMDEAQVRDWMAAGHSIGAHTRTHPRLSRIPVAQAREEIIGSKKSLEDRFGVAVQHFCYPYGDYSPQVRDLVEEAGFATAVTVDPGVYRPACDPMLIPRIGARAHSLNFRNVFKRLAGRPLVTVDAGL